MLQQLTSKRLILWTVMTAAALLVVARPAAADADTTPPVLAVPADMHYQLSSPGAIVRMTYRVGVQDDVDKHPRASCLPRSGSRFGVGTTKVTCTASDASGNTVRRSFRITVKAAKSTRVIPAAAKRAVTPYLTARAYRRNSQGTELLGVKVTRATKGAVVKVSCDPNCPGALATPTRHVSRGSVVSLAGLFRGAYLQAGTTVTAITTGKGVNTRTSRILIRAGKAPLIR